MEVCQYFCRAFLSSQSWSILARAGEPEPRGAGRFQPLGAGAALKKNPGPEGRSRSKKKTRAGAAKNLPAPQPCFIAQKVRIHFLTLNCENKRTIFTFFP